MARKPAFHPQQLARISHWNKYVDTVQRCAGEGKMSNGTYIGSTTKQAIFDTFTSLGGLDAMFAWAKDNPDLFYGSLLPRLLPKPEVAKASQSWAISIQRLSHDGTPEIQEVRALPVAEEVDEAEEDEPVEVIDAKEARAAEAYMKRLTQPIIYEDGEAVDGK